MAGYLDSQQQIIDMVLTSHGKMLLSHGELRFVYWAAYDDEIIYGMTGSKTEDPLQREAISGYRFYNLRGEDRTNANYALMTVPPGWDVVPTASISFDRSTVQMSQQNIIQESYSDSVNMGVVRFDSNKIVVDAEYSKESYPRNHRLDGFYVRVLASGTSGYHQQHHTLNDDSEIVVGPELKIDAVTYGD